MTTDLNQLLLEADGILAAHLQLEGCTSNGVPSLKEERCNQCHQLSACNWTHKRNLNALDTAGQLRQLAIAEMLIEQYLNRLQVPPNELAKAHTWLAAAEQFYRQTPTAENL